jgi:hypothetical protein
MTKVYLLSENEFDSVVFGFFETFSEEYESEVQRGEVTENMVAVYLINSFESFLTAEDIDKKSRKDTHYFKCNDCGKELNAQVNGELWQPC